MNYVIALLLADQSYLHPWQGHCHQIVEPSVFFVLPEDRQWTNEYGCCLVRMWRIWLITTYRTRRYRTNEGFQSWNAKRYGGCLDPWSGTSKTFELASQESTFQLSSSAWESTWWPGINVKGSKWPSFGCQKLTRLYRVTTSVNPGTTNRC